MSEKKPIDWDAVEREYSKGTRSNVEIAAEFDISETAIRKRAKKFAWAKDLAAKIKIKADEAVRLAEFEEKFERTDKDRLTEKDLILAEAEIQKRIRIDHRRDIKAQREYVNELQVELKNNVDSFDVIKRISASKQLAEAIKVLIGLEREAFGISDNANGEANQTNTDDAITQAMHAARARLIVN